MKQVVDSTGKEIVGIFRKDDGSFVSMNYAEFKKSKTQHDSFLALNNEVDLLKKQVQQILETLNGKY